MVFEIRLLPSAEKDLEDSILYYQKINNTLATRFHNEFEGLISLLETKPYFEKKYGQIRTCNLRSFPYLIHFVIHQEIKNSDCYSGSFWKAREN